MKRLFLISTALCFLLFAGNASAGPKSAKYRKALELFQSGMYERARTIFESLGDDPLSRGYAALCAGKLGSIEYPSLLASYDVAYPKTPLSSELHFQAGLNLFDARKYDEARDEFDKAVSSEIFPSSRSEYLFKRGFCSFALGDYPDATDWFNLLEEQPRSDYTAPARYAMGYMLYTDKNFAESQKWFVLSEKDARFRDVSRFYINDCRFMQKDYEYVTKHGVELYKTAGPERRSHLGRIISESFLVLGNKEEARKYYDMGVSLRDEMSDSDYFYAGSLLYSMQDYRGAIDNFTKIRNRSDSLGQIASYQLANSYIQQRNKVAALDAFKAASQLDFDQDIKEDATFNHAKLAFDINADGRWFERYLKTYDTSRKGEQIYGYMALARLEARDYLGAIEAYDKMSLPDTEQDNNYLKANYLRATQLVQAGAYRDAVPYLQSATLGLGQHDPFCQLSRYWLAECNYRSGRYSEAYSIFNSLYNLSALDGKAEGKMIPYNIAYSAFKSGDYQSAAKWFDRYISGGDPGCRADAFKRRADCDFARKDYKAAVASYREAAGNITDKDDIYALYRQAICYGLLGKKAEKASVLQTLSDTPAGVPLRDAAIYEYGRTLLDMSSNDKAVEVFEKLRSSSTERSYLVKSLISEAMAYSNMGDYDKSLSCYEAVVDERFSEEYTRNALTAMQSIYQLKKEPGKYLDYLDSKGLSSAASALDREKLYFESARSSFNSSSYDEATALFEKYLDNYPEGSLRAQAWYYLGECYSAKGEKETAREAYAKVLDLPDSGALRESSVLKFARISLALQQYDDAYGAYEHLLNTAKIPENKTEARRGMMRAAFENRDYKTALECADALPEDELTLYIKAKSYLASSRRTEALECLRSLATKPSTPEGAEANYLLVQDAFDRGDFSKVEQLTYDFAPVSGEQSYWLARCFVTLGDSFVEQNRTKQAKTTYESLVAGYVPATEGDDIQSMVQSRLDKLAKTDKR